ncbi:long tail fiber [Enterobacter phage vB_EhoM-IME523]|uniref:Long tail fiber n=1 Tax=Enterobacter phage vB_EhoM-IME523 TaxID=2596709 RepID=A0A7G3KF07_9CAUD|nr:long tail fiber [Enterobacter phage vB_EhoM-IME523]QEA10740.1 long tail fiber [Enterobacter phage vB_EhoM-IME523]
MADLLKPAFRATSGLDAAGEKVINVAKADFNVLDDGVNVEFFIEENTIQQYDPTRGYKKNFAVIYDNRIWTSVQAIPSPAGAFVELYWKAVRTDPKWVEIVQPTHSLKSGEYVTINSDDRACTLSLPATPQDGDTIVIKDIGTNAGYLEQKIRATNQYIIRNGVQVQETILTKRNSYNILIYSERLWQMYETANEEKAIRVVPGSPVRILAGDLIARRYPTAGAVQLILPKFANDGDFIRTVDVDGMGSVYHLIISTFDNTSSIGKAGTTSMEFRTSGHGMLIYSAADKLWRVWDADLRTRLRIIRDNVKLLPNESVIVFGENNSNVQTITLDMPTDVAIGDTVKIALNYLRKNQTAVIRVAQGSTDKILTDIKLLQFPKRSEYPPDATWVSVSSLTFNGDISYTPVIEFSYTEDNGVGVWVIAQNVPTVERVDPLNDATRKRLGVIALASQAEANVDRENNPVKEQAITPETLANRVATEARRGIARIATTAQVNQITEFAFQDDLIISPKKLNEKQATETMRGLAEIATQVETDAGTDDARIVTPKKLNDRKATESLTGIAKLVSTVGTAKGSSRAVMGTNVYNKNNNTDIVTPKSLNQLKGEYEDQGLFYSATEAEVISGTVTAGFENVAVTPIELHKKTATEGRIGFSEIATQVETDAGTDDFRFITPKKLNDRKATQTLTGIARIATQTEFDAGTLDNVISTPLKIKTRFNDTARTSVIPASGLVETGTLWDHYTLDIKEASETQRGTLKLATQALTDAGVDDTTAVTPLKLQKKKATESTEGIIQIATQAETVAGTVGNKAVVPVHLKYLVQQEKSWEATPLRRGFVKMTEGPLTWAGDNVKGSIENQETFLKDGYAVSPYEMNLALSHYLPISAKAVDSDKLDGLDSLQFIRRDIDQTVEGKLTLTKETTLSAPLTSSSSAIFTGTVQTGKTVTTDFTIQNGTNVWNFVAAKDATTLNIGESTLILNTSSGNVAAKNNISAGKVVSAGESYSHKGRTIVDSTAIALNIGDNAQNLVLKTLDAGNIIANGGGTYKVLTEKNVKEIVARDFVKKEGDTMGGKLTVEAPVLPQISEAKAMAPLTVDTVGFWMANITTPSVYQQLPGYAIPEFATNDQGNPYVDSYTYKPAPGLMTCSGVSIDNIYRTWTPRPIGVADNENALTQYISIWDVARGVWGEWSRVLTSQLPPTPSEIGAVASSGSAFNNLRIRDWLQIGNVRIEPDQATQTVKFTWIP